MDVAALLSWYERVRRPLPWRFTRDPYALLVSEVMLQQTQALRVVPYWERWLERFPDAGALASAPARDVLLAWSGLGYNRRALALQAAARVVAESGWPPDLTTLPGVGPYTAAAVSSFAWDAQVAAVDTNVRRVLSRRDGVALSGRALTTRATSLLPAGRAATFNQAMMELGATICRPRTPLCADCPVSAGCAEPSRRREEAAAAAVPAGSPAGRRRDAATAGSAAGRRDAATAGLPAGRRDPAAARRPASPRVRFEDTDRWARGRVLAALLADEPPPVSGDRLERALTGLERDGLIVRDADGVPRLP
jgi:A/G-specific adenine glycosylase